MADDFQIMMSKMIKAFKEAERNGELKERARIVAIIKKRIQDCKYNVMVVSVDMLENLIQEIEGVR